MYSYLSSYSLKKELRSQFNNNDISNQTMEYIFNNYIKVYLTLNYSYNTSSIIVDFDQLKESYRNSSATLTQLLTTLPNGFFNPVSSLPTYLINRVRYIDAGLAGFTFSEINQKDILLTCPADIGSNDFISYCLTTVNDYIMPVSLINNQLIIQNGFLNCAMNQNSRVGIISFEDIGGIITTSITPNMVVLSPNASPLDLIYINASLPNPNYITLLVLNGYLITPDNSTFYPTGNGNFALSLNNFNVVYKLLESETSQFFNSSFISNYFTNRGINNFNNQFDSNYSINLTEKDYAIWQEMLNNNQFFYFNSTTMKSKTNYNVEINTTLLNSPQFISAYLTLPNTFLVQIPANNLTVINQNILNTELMNSLTTEIQPTNLLTGAQGKIVDYFYTYRDGKYIVTSPGMYINNYITKYLNTSKLDLVTNQRRPNDPLVQSSLYWKELNFY